MKKCTKCGIEKEESLDNFCFYTKREIYEAQCRICRNTRMREIRASKPKVPRKKKERKPKEYYEEYKKIWRAKNKEKIKNTKNKYREKNKEHLLECARKWNRENRKITTEIIRRHRQKNPFKTRARKMLQYYVAQGKVTRPDQCEKCNKICKVDAHHVDYGRPLDVIWLCRQCHAKEHNDLT